MLRRARGGGVVSLDLLAGLSWLVLWYHLSRWLVRIVVLVLAAIGARRVLGGGKGKGGKGPGLPL